MPGPDDPTAPAPDPQDEPAVRRAVVRRAPRYRRFVLAGLLVGVLLALVLWLVVELPRVSREGGPWATDRLLVLTAALLLVGALGGAATAVLVERRDPGPPR